MATNSGRPWHEAPSVYRTVTAGSLLTVSGAPQRNAATLIVTNGHLTTIQSIVFQGPDGANVTLTLPFQSVLQIDGEFTSITSVSDVLVTVVAAWFHDGSVRVN